VIAVITGCAPSRRRRPYGTLRACSVTPNMTFARCPAAWAALLLAVSAGPIGCSSDDSTHYGPPGGLIGKMLPLPPSTGSSGSDSGSSAVFDAGSGALPDGGSCAVSWSTQIAPNMAPGGKWRCGDSTCHGGLQGPKITADPVATYAALASYTMQFAPRMVRYVVPGNTDPTASGIECNLSGATCGNQMPLTFNGALPLSSQDLADLDTWVRCGAPAN
jgi:hypothetical protein